MARPTNPCKSVEVLNHPDEKTNQQEDALFLILVKNSKQPSLQLITF